MWVLWVRSTLVNKWVTKRVTYTEFNFSTSMMTKEKFLAKGKKGKCHLTPQQKKDNINHEGRQNQQWKAQKMDEAQEL